MPAEGIHLNANFRLHVLERITNIVESQLESATCLMPSLTGRFFHKFRDGELRDHGAHDYLHVMERFYGDEKMRSTMSEEEQEAHSECLKYFEYGQRKIEARITASANDKELKEAFGRLSSRIKSLREEETDKPENEKQKKRRNPIMLFKKFALGRSEH